MADPSHPPGGQTGHLATHLGQKYAGLPLWAWGGLATAGAVVALRFLRSRGSTAAAAVGGTGATVPAQGPVPGNSVLAPIIIGGGAQRGTNTGGNTANVERVSLQQDTLAHWQEAGTLAAERALGHLSQLTPGEAYNLTQPTRVPDSTVTSDQAAQYYRTGYMAAAAAEQARLGGAATPAPSATTSGGA